MNKRILVASLMTLCAMGCTTRYPQDMALPKIHPRAFAMTRCWLSDTEEPVATEINLDAIQKDRNQFDYKALKDDGAWIRSDREDGQGFDRYRIIHQKGHAFVVDYQSNGGGTLTTSSRIGCSLLNRSMDVNGVTKDVQVLRIDSLQSL